MQFFLKARRPAVFVQFAIAVTFLLTSCGKKPTPDEQNSTSLEVPTFGTAAMPAFLTGGSSTTEYSGSFIIWNPSVTRDQMARVISASRDYNQTFVRQLTFQKAELWPLENQIAALTQTLKDSQSEKNLALLAVRQEAAGRWFEEHLQSDDLAGLDDTDRAQAHATFEALCEAAIWQKAVSSIFARSNYRSVPTPLALCREVYAQKGLLSATAETCAPAPTASGKNYFACFWQEGLTKTNLFQRYSVGKRTELLSIDVETLRQALADSSSLGLKITRQMDNVVIGARAFGFKLEGQSIAASATLANATTDLIYTTFLSKSLTSPHADALGLVSNLRTDRTADVMPAADRLREQLRTFTEKLNDSKMNEPLLVRAADETPPGIAPEIDQSPYLSIFQASDASLDRTVQQAASRLSEAEARLPDIRKVGGSLGAGQSCSDFSDNYTCKTKTALEAQADAVQVEGVGLAMMSGTELVMHRSENGMLAFVLTFNNRDTDVRQLRGCLDVTTGKMVDDTSCEWTERLMQKEDVSSAGIEHFAVDLDVNNGKLAFTLNPIDLPMIGLNEKARQPGEIDFNLLSADRWKSKEVRIELYPTELDGLLAIYSGSGKVKDETESLATTVSLTSEIR